MTLPALPAKAGQKITLGQLVGSSLSLIAARLTSEAKGPVLLITADTPSALRLEQELQYLLADKQLADQSAPVLLFPDWETLPYDTFSPHQDIISQRLETLYKLPQMSKGVLIVPISTLMLRCAPRVYLDKYSLMVKAGQRLNLQQLRGRLAEAGYVAVDQVLEHGEFAARGSLLDLFPMGSSSPYRIDFFDDEVDSIRPFDPETQRSSEPVKTVSLLPAREYPTDEAAIELFRGQFREQFELSRAEGSVYQEVSKGRWPAGIEYYLPLFFNQTASLFDYLPEETLLLTVGDIYPAAQRFWNDIGQRYEDRRWDNTRPLLPPAQLYLPVEQLFASLGQYGAVRLQEAATAGDAGQHDLPISRRCPTCNSITARSNPCWRLTSSCKALPGAPCLRWNPKGDGRCSAICWRVSRCNLKSSPPSTPLWRALIVTACWWHRLNVASCGRRPVRIHWP